MTNIEQYDPSPDLEDVQQVEPPDSVIHIAPVAVRQVGPVATNELPCRMGAAFTQILTTDMQTVVSGPDDKRKQVRFTADGSFRLSFTGAAGSGALFVVAAGGSVTFPVTYIGQIWAASVTSTVNLGVIAEYWAD